MPRSGICKEAIEECLLVVVVFLPLKRTILDYCICECILFMQVFIKRGFACRRIGQTAGGLPFSLFGSRDVPRISV